MARLKKEKEEKPVQLNGLFQLSHDLMMDVVPNCSKCKYFGISKRFLKASEYRCLAMGCVETINCYGQPDCKKNYEER